MDYQWYPGHMTKARRMMEENIRLVDLVIEILDARVPLSSRNPDIDRMAGGRSRLVLLAKADLADPEKTELFLRSFEKQGITALAVDARSGESNAQIRRAIQAATKERRERNLRRGLTGRPVRAMVCGIPNAGKSTLINSLAGRKSARTGNTPGVTRGKQWISLGEIDLLDTPGILWPKFEDRQVGVRLALIGSIRGEILDEEELSLELLSLLSARYPALLAARYGAEIFNEGDFAGPVPGENRLFDMRKTSPAPDSGENNDAVRPGMSYNSNGVPSGEPDSAPEGLRPQRPGTDGAAGEEARLHALLVRIARARSLKRSGGEPDTRRAAQLLLDEFRSGTIGRITLDEPEELRG